MDVKLSDNELLKKAISVEKKLPFTGERYVPELSGNVELEHLHRYFVSNYFVKGKKVLDIACGEGYGSSLLSNTASIVIGVDISESTILHARERYVRSNLKFIVGDCSTIPIADKSIDVVVSFETIEHHENHELMLSEFRRILRPNGILLISSPNKEEYSDKTGYKNLFHIRELYFDEFYKLIKRHFDYQSSFGQRIVFGSLIMSMHRNEYMNSKIFNDHDIIAHLDRLLNPLYFLIIASNSPLSSFNTSILEKSINESEVVDNWRKLYESQDIRIQNLISNTNLSFEKIKKEKAIKRRMADDIISLKKNMIEQDRRYEELKRNYEYIMKNTTMYFRKKIERCYFSNIQKIVEAVHILSKHVDVTTKKMILKNSVIERLKHTRRGVLTHQVTTKESIGREGKISILLVSHYCPTVAHAGGLRIIDLFTFIRKSNSNVKLDLFTNFRSEIDWNTKEIFEIFDNVYSSSEEELSLREFLRASNKNEHYDIVDLQFHQSGRFVEEYKEIGKKILFTPMESMVHNLVQYLKAAFCRNINIQTKEIHKLIICALEEIKYCKEADLTICVSNSDKKILRKICRLNKVTAIETGLSYLEFKEPLQPGFNVSAPEMKKMYVIYVAYFGSETNIKALDWYLDYVHEIVKNTVPEYRLLVVGRGDLEIFKRKNIASIDLVGEVPRVMPYISKAKVGIAPALSGAGFRGKINQYSILGVPTVASPIALKGLLYEDNVNIYKADNHRAFADRTITLLTDNETNLMFGQRARDLCLKNYTWKSKIEQIVSTYELGITNE